jgi:hypothetical protein
MASEHQTKHEAKLAETAKKMEEEQADREARNTILGLKGKSTVPKKAPLSSEKYRDDVLRRVNRRESDAVSAAQSIEEKGHVLTVTMPNKLKVRLTLNDDKPVPAVITRADIVRWEAVA